jgi:HEPN domain-containing protein
MTETAAEWLRKADADIATARRELAVQDEPNFDAVCFHAQQCIEKLMKAGLMQRGITPPRTHDLVALAASLGAAGVAMDFKVANLRLLTRAAVDFRYPGESADREEATLAFDIASRLRAQLVAMLPTEP